MTQTAIFIIKLTKGQFPCHWEEKIFLFEFVFVKGSPTHKEEGAVPPTKEKGQSHPQGGRGGPSHKRQSHPQGGKGQSHPQGGRGSPTHKGEGADLPTKGSPTHQRQSHNREGAIPPTKGSPSHKR